MSLVSFKDLLWKARKGNYAIGQFNINGSDWVQAILQAAQEEAAPVILGASDRLIEYLGGFKTIVGMVKGCMEEMSINVPVVLHLDHGMNVERCKRAIDCGFSSVMIDGSHYSLEENIAMTREVVAYAHPRNVTVEAEVGIVGGKEDGVLGRVKYADPTECLRLVEETGVDALAAALGSVHGPYHSEPKFGFREMREIAQLVNVPLVLHGASGVPELLIKRIIQLGHAKINVNTEAVQAWATAVRQVLVHDDQLYDPQAILSPGKQAIVSTVKAKIREFSSNQKARLDRLNRSWSADDFSDLRPPMGPRPSVVVG